MDFDEILNTLDGVKAIEEQYHVIVDVSKQFVKFAGKNFTYVPAHTPFSWKDNVSGGFIDIHMLFAFFIDDYKDNNNLK